MKTEFYSESGWTLERGAQRWCGVGILRHRTVRAQSGATCWSCPAPKGRQRGQSLEAPSNLRSSSFRLRCVKQLKKKRKRKRNHWKCCLFSTCFIPNKLTRGKSRLEFAARSRGDHPRLRDLPRTALFPSPPAPPHTASRAPHSRTRHSAGANARTRGATAAGPALPRGSRLPPALTQHLPRLPPPPSRGPGLLQLPVAVAAPPAPSAERAAASRGTGGAVPRGQVSGARLGAEGCAGRGGSARAAAAAAKVGAALCRQAEEEARGFPGGGCPAELFPCAPSRRVPVEAEGSRGAREG